MRMNPILLATICFTLGIFRVGCIILVESITCQSGELYVKVQKYSGPSGEKETYTIYGLIDGVKTAVLEGQAAESYSYKIVEGCLAQSQDLVYTIEISHRYRFVKFVS